MMPVLLLCLMAATPDDETAHAQFSLVQVEEQFAPLIWNDPLLMQALNQVKVAEGADGRRTVIAVASVVLDGQSPRDRLMAEQVCRAKALAALIARTHPVRLVQTEQLQEQSSITVKDGRESGAVATEFRRTIHTHVEGTVHDLPVIGRWMSRDRSTLYLAIGTVSASDPGPASHGKGTPLP